MRETLQTHSADLQTAAKKEAELHAAACLPPEYYNDDQAWGGAIARAVGASQQVQLWPRALQRLGALHARLGVTGEHYGTTLVNTHFGSGAACRA